MLAPLSEDAQYFFDMIEESEQPQNRDYSTIASTYTNDQLVNEMVKYLKLDHASNTVNTDDPVAAYRYTILSEESDRRFNLEGHANGCDAPRLADAADQRYAAETGLPYIGYRTDRCTCGATSK